MKKSIKTISFIGAGNVATNLAAAFFDNGIQIDFIYSRKIESANALANTVNATAICDLSNIVLNSDLTIVALKDDVIKKVLASTDFTNTFLVHTSGSFNSDELRFFSSNFGCFYPFQTFRKEVKADFKNIQLFMEGNTVENKDLLIELGQLLSDKVKPMNSEERRALHIGGVGINNFTHFILSQTKQYCEENNLEVTYFSELLNQTIQNSFYKEDSIQLQTGPARRGDVSLIQSHIKQLESDKNYQKIYQTISQLILDQYHEDQFKL